MTVRRPFWVQGRRVSPADEILRTQLPVIDQGQAHRVSNDRPELLHQVQGKGRLAVPGLMVETQMGIEPNGESRHHRLLDQHGIEKGKDRVNRVPRNVAGNWLQPGGQLYLGHQEIARA